MPLATGDVVFAWFPYQEGPADNLHPTVVLVPDLPGGSALVCCVTTKKNRFDSCIELHPEDFLGGGMETWPSYVRPYRIATINTDEMRRKLGQLRPEIIKKIKTPIEKRLTDI
ncbi:MAG: type II toxin-antitoxin system PemK/MazF family toxin [Pseudodesulfovibrio sp.]|nr:type II toxin-antitoxin system PemK/MazF family toxin [Pseudodesulfovibrio sp.]